MDAKGHWEGGAETTLRDGRGHSITVDLPKDEGGRDAGTSGLELAALSLAGCITTIFALVARRRRLSFESMDVDLRADRPRGAKTISRVEGTLRVRSRATLEEVSTALAVTLRTCPVGVLFAQAGIPVEVRAIVESPETPSGPSAEATP